MALDVQCTYPQQLIQISAVSLLPGLEEPTVEVIGDDFSAVDEVLLNEIPSPAVIILSKTKLTAVLPTQVQGQSTINVTVVSYKLVFTERSLIAFQFGRTNRKISGINRLLQLFVKMLLTTPGSDIFNKTRGGGALRNIGRTFSKDSSGTLVSDFVISVDNTARQLASIQARTPRLPRDERLLGARVLGARFDASQTALIVSVLLTSQAGTTATAQITL